MVEFLVDMDMNSLITTFGLLGLFVILFAESGLLFGFFLPGDSLLITAGLIASQGNYFGIIPLLIVCVAGAIMGDTAGYVIGSKTGKKIKSNNSNFIVKMGYLKEAEDFYEKHGGKTIVIARFVPAVRSFVPMVAGMSDMHYKDFARFNVIGGIIWGAGLPLIGYYFGHIEWVQHYFEFIIIGIVLFSFIPAAWHILGTKEKRFKLKNNLHEGRAAYREHRVKKKAAKSKS